MADNFAFTEGAGKTGAADDVGGILFAKIKLDFGTDGATAPALAGTGAMATGVQRVTIATDDPATVLLGTIDADTGAIKTAVELLDNAVDGNFLNVNLNAAGADLTMNSGVLTAQTQRVTIATDDECNNFLGAIDADTSNMVTALEIMDDWDDSDKCKVIIQTGANAIGKLAANSGVDIGDVDITSIIPLTGATNLGKARDVACGANDVGVMALAVRDDTLAVLTPADGDLFLLE